MAAVYIRAGDPAVCMELVLHANGVQLPTPARYSVVLDKFGLNYYFKEGVPIPVNTRSQKHPGDPRCFLVINILTTAHKYGSGICRCPKSN